MMKIIKKRLKEGNTYEAIVDITRDEARKIKELAKVLGLSVDEVILSFCYEKLR